MEEEEVTSAHFAVLFIGSVLPKGCFLKLQWVAMVLLPDMGQADGLEPLTGSLMLPSTRCRALLEHVFYYLLFLFPQRPWRFLVWCLNPAVHNFDKGC